MENFYFCVEFIHYFMGDWNRTKVTDPSWNLKYAAEIEFESFDVAQEVLCFAKKRVEEDAPYATIDTSSAYSRIIPLTYSQATAQYGLFALTEALLSYARKQGPGKLPLDALPFEARLSAGVRSRKVLRWSEDHAAERRRLYLADVHSWEVLRLSEDHAAVRRRLLCSSFVEPKVSSRDEYVSVGLSGCKSYDQIASEWNSLSLADRTAIDAKLNGVTTGDALKQKRRRLHEKKKK